MAEFWTEILYRPLFNILVWIYNNFTTQSMGWAIVYLTILLRLALLPFTFIAERNKVRNEKILMDVKKLEKAYYADAILRKEEVRRVLKERKVRYWAKAFELGVQVLVLVLLYQVFIGGIAGERLIRSLYPWVDFPGRINSIFYGFQLSLSHSTIAAGIVALFVLGDIYINYWKRKTKLTRGDLAYFILFPAFTFTALWLLPTAKSLFIMTSLLFGTVAHFIIRNLIKPKTEAEASK